MPTPRRIIFRLLLPALLLGSLTTVLVSWAIVLRVRRLPSSGIGWSAAQASYTIAQGPVVGGGACRAIEVTRFTRPGTVGYTSFAAFFTGWPPVPPQDAGVPSSQFVPAWARAALIIPPAPDPDPGTDQLYRAVTATGWPMAALWHTYALSPSAPSVMPGALTLHVPMWLNLNADHTPGGVAALPVRVIPLGFAVNTALYSAGWCGLLWLVPAARRARRRRRGLCQWCAYDLRGATTLCPECGRAG